jgi:hypothetical protein
LPTRRSAFFCFETCPLCLTSRLALRLSLAQVHFWSVFLGPQYLMLLIHGRTLASCIALNLHLNTEMPLTQGMGKKPAALRHRYSLHQGASVSSTFPTWDAPVPHDASLPTLNLLWQTHLFVAFTMSLSSTRSFPLPLPHLSHWGQSLPPALESIS